MKEFEQDEDLLGTCLDADQDIHQDIDALWAEAEQHPESMSSMSSMSGMGQDSFDTFCPAAAVPARHVVCPTTQDVRAELLLDIKKRKVTRIKARLAQEYDTMVGAESDVKDGSEGAADSDNAQTVMHLYRNGYLIEFARSFNLTRRDYGLKEAEDDDPLALLAWDHQVESDAELAAILETPLFSNFPSAQKYVERELSRWDLVTNAMACLAAWLRRCVSEQTCSMLLASAEQLAKEGTKGIVFRPWRPVDVFTNPDYWPHKKQDMPWLTFWGKFSKGYTVEHDRLALFLDQIELVQDRLEALHVLHEACRAGKVRFNLLFDPLEHFCFLSRFDQGRRLEAFKTLLWGTKSN